VIVASKPNLVSDQKAAPVMEILDGSLYTDVEVKLLAVKILATYEDKQSA
jgi:hypothetical protein